MNFKNSLRIVMVTAMISLTLPGIAAPEPIATNKPGKDAQTSVHPLLQRLQEIKEMDKSQLTTSERKALRKEVKNMKQEVRTNSNGIYLSVGAIIIVILLLILIL